jgi:hypothetical protein
MRHQIASFLFKAFVCLSLAAPLTAAQSPRVPSSPNGLTIVSAGPTGEIAELAQANEIRVFFSEPMVVLGRIPQPLRPSPASSGGPGRPS